MMPTNGSFYLLLLFVLGAIVNASPIEEKQERLVGGDKCTWGPQYWCQNFGTAKNCRATRHCIQTSWERHYVQIDNDDICKICKDMVQQARDQLRSNETEEELKQVFEGSCQLIRIKPVVKECIKLADDFLPELVEALSSEMDPDQVCSVAGLCNSAKIDLLLDELAALEGTYTKPEGTGDLQLSCDTCNQLSGHLVTKLQSLSHGETLKHILHLCDRMSAYSDACATKVLTYSKDIYHYLQNYITADGICHISGICANKYHKHVDDIEPKTEVITFNAGDDVPCKLCEQLVHHLRDVLVANTTEDEFKQVLNGLCQQTKSFKQECTSIVDQYYHVIYETLVNDLDANSACFLIGICPKGNRVAIEGPTMPQLPEYVVTEKPQAKLGLDEPSFAKEQVNSMVLPIDTLVGALNPNALVEGGQKCTLCEFILHFIQETLATPADEEKIKSAVKNVCRHLPNGVQSQCKVFVDDYGDAVISMLIQDLNPVDVCPKLQMCPAAVAESNKQSCPLCMLAVSEAKEKIGQDTTKSHIKDVLSHLCDSLPPKLRPECVDFVDTYTNELVDKLIADFSAKEICTDLLLCPKPKKSSEEYDYSLPSNEIDSGNSNEISQEDDKFTSPNCLLCEELVKEVEKKYKKSMTRDEIQKMLQRSCEKFNKPLQKQCHKYVDKYGDQLANLILLEVQPKTICTELGLCLFAEQQSHATPSCELCEFVMAKLQLSLKNATDIAQVTRVLDNICNEMPATLLEPCSDFVAKFSHIIVKLIQTVPPKEICSSLHLCFPHLSSVVTDDVIECGVCYGASRELALFYQSHNGRNFKNTLEYIDVACQNLPAKYYTMCSKMISVYGATLWNAAKKMRSMNICSEIGKCYVDENSVLAFATMSRF